MGIHTKNQVAEGMGEEEESVNGWTPGIIGLANLGRGIGGRRMMRWGWPVPAAADGGGHSFGEDEKKKGKGGEDELDK
jgi:hypothetical protein